MRRWLDRSFLIITSASILFVNFPRKSADCFLQIFRVSGGIIKSHPAALLKPRMKNKHLKMRIICMEPQSWHKEGEGGGGVGGQFNENKNWGCNIDIACAQMLISLFSYKVQSTYLRPWNGLLTSGSRCNEESNTSLMIEQLAKCGACWQGIDNNTVGKDIYPKDVP